MAIKKEMERMGELAVKEVEFNGSTLMAAQVNDDNKIYVAVRWVCEGIGLTKGQMQNERKRLKQDLVLNQGERNLVLPTEGGNQEVLCIELDFLPLWLAKISITPKMQKESPFVVKNLVEYQLKAKDVLAEAFIKSNQLSSELQFLQGMLDRMAHAELEQKEMKGKIVHLETEFHKETSVEGYVTSGNVARGLSIFSVTDKPHVQFIDAVASELGIYNTKIGYEDEYVKVARQTSKGGIVTGVAYYSPKGEDLIREYVENKFEPDEKVYVRGTKKGQFNTSTYTIGNTTYRFNESTQRKYEK